MTPTKAQLSDLDTLVERLRDGKEPLRDWPDPLRLEAADALVALKAERDRVEQERDRAFEALHPGPMPVGNICRPHVDAPWSLIHYYTHGPDKDWVDRANLYERITGKRIGDEG